MSQVAIFVEGKTDKNFIGLLLDEMGLDKDKVKFFILGSKSNFFKPESNQYKELLVDIEQEIIEKVLFVLDADEVENNEKYGGYANTEKELTNTIRALGIKDSDVYIMCDLTDKTGCLESLILSSISVEQKQCIDNFLSCSEFKDKESHKAILYKIYKIAYPQAPYDFSHKNFEPLKGKFKQLFQ